jgi:hypothetical protein
LSQRGRASEAESRQDFIAKEAKDQGAMGPEFLRAQPSGFASGGSIVSSDDMINSEMTDGYRDGLDPDSPEPSANRTQSYRYGFLNGRDDLRHAPRVLGESMAPRRLSRLGQP